MSTRSTTHFTYGDERHPKAIVYRHSDGYPEGAGKDIARFLDECAGLQDSRMGDPSYLAAKYVVFLAREFAPKWKTSPLEFLSVGIVAQDPGDIEYRYVIDCKHLQDGRPKVTCYGVSWTWDQKSGKDVPMGKWTLTEVPIPA